MVPPVVNSILVKFDYSDFPDDSLLDVWANKVVFTQYLPYLFSSCIVLLQKKEAIRNRAIS